MALDANNQLVPSNRIMTGKVSTSLLPNTSAIPSVPSNQTLPASVLIKDFALDENKSLEKKSYSCAKEHLKYELKAGNNLVIERSTAA